MTMITYMGKKFKMLTHIDRIAIRDEHELEVGGYRNDKRFRGFYYSSDFDIGERKLTGTDVRIIMRESGLLFTHSGEPLVMVF